MTPQQDKAGKRRRSASQSFTSSTTQPPAESRPERRRYPDRHRSKPKEPFAIIERHVFLDPRLKAKDRLMLAALALRACRAKSAEFKTPPHGWHHSTAMSERSADRALAQLRALGWLVRLGRGRYRLTFRFGEGAVATDRWVRLPCWILPMGCYSGCAKALYLLLAAHAKPSGWCNPDRDRLRMISGYGVGEHNKQLGELRAAALVKTTRKVHRRYELRWASYSKPAQGRVKDYMVRLAAPAAIAYDGRYEPETPSRTPTQRPASQKDPAILEQGSRHIGAALLGNCEGKLARSDGDRERPVMDGPGSELQPVCHAGVAAAPTHKQRTRRLSSAAEARGPQAIGSLLGGFRDHRRQPPGRLAFELRRDLFHDPPRPARVLSLRQFVARMREFAGVDFTDRAAFDKAARQAILGGRHPNALYQRYLRNRRES